MAAMQLYVHPIRRSGQAEALFGFMLTGRPAPSARPLTDQDRARKIHHLLEGQLHMVARFWNSGILAWDLRFVKVAYSASIMTGVLCRIACPAYRTQEQYSRYCQASAQQVQTLFREFGYELVPLSDWSGLKLFLQPFEYQALAEIRRREDLCEIRYTHETYEFYVTYPWKWSGAQRQRLLDVLIRSQHDTLVSICLQPTRLSDQEQRILQHITSGTARGELLHAGPLGSEALGIYQRLAHDLQQPFLLRIALASSSDDSLKNVGQAFLEELEPSGNARSRPVLQYPTTAYEEQALRQNLSSLEQVRWGSLRDNVPDTARLRYLVDSKEGSMAFRLPLTEERRAVILTALRVEYEAVRMHLSDVREETYGGTIYECGSFIAGKGRWEVVIAQIGAGGTAAAAEAERAIEHFKPHVTLFVGVAGGLKDVALGDVVVATKVYGYESGKVTEQRFKARPEVGQSSHLMVQRANAEARKADWLQRLRHFDAATPGSPQVFVGPIAAGEKVLASTQSDLYALLQSTYEDALAIEMESHGFLQATYRHTEVQALIVRGISDLINNKSEVDKQGFQKIASRNASAFAFEVLAKLDIQLH
ncbi:MAG TPA: 5'-methylthioadenosine/S-adenosylhomocysteine nucleosidase [Ktedonobacteraceae bacterium]|nr:5'-methylthioadenosine/S-adenosylhomocysteine nucleosidase [Ktedonobacteraceae bacterium]